MKYIEISFLGKPFKLWYSREYEHILKYLIRFQKCDICFWYIWTILNYVAWHENLTKLFWSMKKRHVFKSVEYKACLLSFLWIPFPSNRWYVIQSFIFKVSHSTKSKYRNISLLLSVTWKMASNNEFCRGHEKKKMHTHSQKYP